MKLRWYSTLVACLISSPLFLTAQDSVPLVQHVSGNIPVQATTSMQVLSADRPFMPLPSQPPAENPTGHPWKLEVTLPGAVIHDLSFASPLVGYAAAELGQVYKTTDGGNTWNEILNLGSPYYFYGVSALTTNDVVISGFYDSSSFEGLIRWSHDGGNTWSSDIDLTSTGWVQRVRFPNADDGLIMDLIGGSSGNLAEYTTDGGATVADWTTVIDNLQGNWFGLQFSLLQNLHARASGINFCKSAHGGAAWTCGPSVDSVFDGPVFFLNDLYGWVGGGEISPNVEGWAHVTTDGGKTWSGRTLDGPWPIREILFRTPKIGWAAGGNLYTGVGGIYYSSDGGQTWTVDVTTNAEMDACDKQVTTSSFDIWCAGYNSSFSGVIYKLQLK